MKILWHSNSPWSPTGYGSQTALFGPPLAKHHDLAISSFYGLEGARIKWDGIPVFPGLGGEFGNDYIEAHASSHFEGDLRGGLLMTLLDVWVLQPERVAGMNAACWTPVDHTPATPMQENFFDKSGAVPIAMSRFGEQQLARFEPLYVPHAVDTSVYKPRNRAKIRKQVRLSEDAFVVGMVAANKGRPSRKGFQQALQAFRIFGERHDDAFLYLHTTMDPKYSEGEHLGGLIDSLGIPMSVVRMADQYTMMFDPYPQEAMSWIYSALDVLLNPSMGEGFGLPVLEAQACGTPAIVTDFSAMKEVCGAGWHVNWRPFWTYQRSWQAEPDVEDIVEALEQAYSKPRAARKALSEQAREHAMTYDIKRVMDEYMLPAIEAAAARYQDRKPLELAVA